jgi:hypothetical protein
MSWELDSNPQPDPSEQCYAPFSFGDAFLGAYVASRLVQETPRMFLRLMRLVSMPPLAMHQEK